VEQILEQVASCLENGVIECGGEFEIRPGGLLCQRVACESCAFTTDVFALSTTCEAVLRLDDPNHVLCLSDIFLENAWC
jgi:hypothetical protein